MYNNFQYQDPYMGMGQNMNMNPNDDRFFFAAPFLLGGLAGGALGYGLANNNNQNNYYQPYPYPVPVYPVNNCPNCPGSTNNNYYYYQ